MIAQKYRLTFTRQKELAPDVNRALGQQFANADEMFETLFTELKRLQTMIIERELGDVSGPLEATDNALVLWDGPSGDLIKDSEVFLSDLASSHHHTTHEPGGSDPLAVDAAAATGSLRTLGTGALQATSGTDARLSDARTPTAHHTTHEPGGSDPLAVDAAAATGSLRTLGTGALQATAGTDSRLSNARTPTAHHTTHESGGSDVVTLAESQVTNLTTDLAAKVAGPSSATDNAVARFDATTGKLIQDSLAVVDDSGDLTVPAGAFVGFVGRSIVRAPATGQFTVSNSAETAGVGIDVATDGTIKIRNRAQSADAIITAATASAGTSTTQVATTAFATTADNLKAPLASPALTGTPTAPTAGAGTNTTQLATTAFVQTAISPSVTAWTPNDASAASPALTLTVDFASYVVLGNIVFISYGVTYPTTSDTHTATVGGLPFAANGQGYGAVFFSDGTGPPHHVLIDNGVTSMRVFKADHSVVTNANLSGKILRVSGWYFR